MFKSNLIPKPLVLKRKKNLNHNPLLFCNQTTKYDQNRTSGGSISVNPVASPNPLFTAGDCAWGNLLIYQKVVKQSTTHIGTVHV